MKVGSDCFSEIKVQGGNQTPQTQTCCCQPHSCSFWCLMLSIILFTYSLQDITLLHISVYFSSSICLKRVQANWSWDQTITRQGLIKQVYDLLTTDRAPSASRSHVPSPRIWHLSCGVNQDTPQGLCEEELCFAFRSVKGEQVEMMDTVSLCHPSAECCGRSPLHALHPMPSACSAVVFPGPQ